VPKASRPGWEPARLKQQREAHGLTLEQAGERLRQAADNAGIVSPAANFQTLWAHENGDIYPGPPYRRAYCLLYNLTEPELGFRRPLPHEGTAAQTANDTPGLRASAVATLVTAGPNSEHLLAEFRAAVMDKGGPRRCLVLVAGYAGSGKTELSRVLAGETRWALVDKDTITRPLVEDLLQALGLAMNDRHTEGYLEKVRPLEYECLQETSYENLARGNSTIATAPYIRELQDGWWVRQTARAVERLGATLVPIWVRCDGPSMREHIELRAADRDHWKLANWDSYVQGLTEPFVPSGPHLIIDNTQGAAVEYCDRNKTDSMR
jgi:predicted kinase